MTLKTEVMELRQSLALANLKQGEYGDLKLCGVQERLNVRIKHEREPHCRGQPNCGGSSKRQPPHDTSQFPRLTISDQKFVVWRSPWASKCLQKRQTRVAALAGVGSETARKERGLYPSGPSGSVAARHTNEVLSAHSEAFLMARVMELIGVAPMSEFLVLDTAMAAHEVEAERALASREHIHPTHQALPKLYICVVGPVITWYEGQWSYN